MHKKDCKNPVSFQEKGSSGGNDPTQNSPPPPPTTQRSSNRHTGGKNRCGHSRGMLDILLTLAARASFLRSEASTSLPPSCQREFADVGAARRSKSCPYRPVLVQGPLTIRALLPTAPTDTCD